MSLAWCPNCEMLTNDVSTPCHKCGGPLEYATLEPNPEQKLESGVCCPNVPEVMVCPQLTSSEAEIECLNSLLTALREENERLERKGEADANRIEELEAETELLHSRIFDLETALSDQEESE